MAYSAIRRKETDFPVSFDVASDIYTDLLK
jgi:hypothetical protein